MLPRISLGKYGIHKTSIFARSAAIPTFQSQSPFSSSSSASTSSTPIPPKALTSNKSPFEKESFILNDANNFFHNVAAEGFPPDIAEKLASPVDAADVEVKPDGIIYFPGTLYK